MSELKKAESPDQHTVDQKTQTHPLTTSRRLKRTLQEYEQSLLRQPAVAEEDVLEEEALPAQVQNSKQVCVESCGHAFALCMHTSSVHSIYRKFVGPVELHVGYVATSQSRAVLQHSGSSTLPSKSCDCMQASSSPHAFVFHVVLIAA
jgi:hypothetical protein